MFFFLGQSVKKKHKQIIHFEALYLDLENLKQSKSNWGGVGCCLLGESVPLLPGAESDFWPTLLSREQWSYQKSGPGGDLSSRCW